MHEGVRQYYAGQLPNVLQVGEHHFVERRVIDLWVHLILTSWYAQRAWSHVSIEMTVFAQDVCWGMLACLQRVFSKVAQSQSSVPSWMAVQYGIAK